MSLKILIILIEMLALGYTGALVSPPSECHPPRTNGKAVQVFKGQVLL